jgi:hypothetical protein
MKQNASNRMAAPANRDNATQTPPPPVVLEVRAIATRIKCGHCGKQFGPTARKVVNGIQRTWCPGCGTWMDVPRFEAATLSG